ncbi:ATP phosphoribosyltransferase [Arenimonas caeni]|jgi:ATP phosphoribosyltransferase|uniref:ATP phosphoribosyltransferase n=1 Tax=Arenimonas caeni TaxID=2058085 RepID=UPI002A3615EE|nr:ATP phosphoribosyltransferase [Arenimonas caeni]MDY0022728.1 ATP phosphoribosyltransferase [Arenimonas caeni]
MRTHDRLRIAIQKSGRLSDPARDLLARAGLAFRESRDRLFCYGESLPIDLLLVRDDDIPGLIAEGTCDLGVVGQNVLEEQALERAAEGKPEAYRAIRDLGFGRCRLSVAVPNEWEWPGPDRLAGLRIATSYPQLLARWLRNQGVAAEPVVLSGSVEIAPRLGKAEAICDLVSTGATLMANQLKEAAVVFESQAVLAAPATPFGDARAELAAMLLRRLDAVLSVRASKLVLFQAARDAVPDLLKLLPDAEPPTVMAIEGQRDHVALQALCRSAMTWQRLEDMKRAGATGLLVLPVEQMLA